MSGFGFCYPSKEPPRHPRSQIGAPLSHQSHPQPSGLGAARLHPLRHLSRTDRGQKAGSCEAGGMFLALPQQGRG